MKKSLKTTLGKVCLNISFVFFCQIAFPQIIYTDIDPDSTISAPSSSGRSYAFDLNGDQTNDFIFQINNLSPGYESVKIYGNNFYYQILGQGDTNVIEDYYISALDKNDSIGLSNGIWHNDWDYQWNHPLPMTICGYGITNPGEWSGGSLNKFVGLRIKINNHWHYGYVGINIPSTPHTLTIRDFAFETTPDKAILAGGQSNSSIVNDDQNKMIVRVVDQGIQISLTNQLANKSSLTIYNLTGHKLKTEEVNSSQICIDATDIVPGIYIIKLQCNDQQYTSKIILY